MNTRKELDLFKEKCPICKEYDCTCDVEIAMEESESGDLTDSDNLLEPQVGGNYAQENRNFLKKKNRVIVRTFETLINGNKML